MRRVPRLPLLTLGLFFITIVPSLLPYSLSFLGVLALPVSIFLTGYVGAERIWFARLFAGETLDRRGVWQWSWHLWVRYFLLSLVVGLLVLPITAVMTYQGFRVVAEVVEQVEREAEQGGVVDPAQRSERMQELIEERFSSGDDPQAFVRLFLTPPIIALIVLSGLVIDFLLTFATPALAFTTSGPFKALKQGFRLMRQTFPKSLFYVAIPPLAALVTLRLLPVTVFPGFVYLVLSMTGVFLNLWFKGATVAFYLRHVSELEEPTPAGG